jgi:parvulin-like peptidyl-prolyl isomerase
MSREDRRALVLLGVGLASGIALAAFGVAEPAPTGMPAGAVALVNGEPISREALARFSDALDRDREAGSRDGARRQQALQRLIDEELLLQRGLELGLARRDPRARQAIVTAVVSAATAGAELEEPSDEELRSFYGQMEERFRRPLRVRVETARVGVGVESRSESQAFRTASQLVARARAGEAFDALRDELSDGPVAEVEGRAIGLGELGERLGGQVARDTAALEPGGVTDPLRTASGWVVLRLRDRSRGDVPAYELVRSQVRAEYLRRARDRAVERLLEELRQRAEIRIAPAETGAP